MNVEYATLFLDIGGVFLTNGWDHHMRQKAAEKFQIDYNELNSRHALTFDTYEIGKISLDEYLDRVVFYQPRSFSHNEFKDFMYAQSQPYPEMIQLIRDVKSRYSLRTVAVCNEGRELMEKRIDRFHMKEFIDFFICSAFVGLRKPDEEIYRYALDLSQAKPNEVIYIDDRPMLVEIGRKIGFQAIQHTAVDKTRNFLNDLLSVHVH